MAITAKLNRLTFNDADEVRALFSELIGKKVDESFLLIPPFYTAHGNEIRVGRNVFVNQNCTFYDLGGLDIADEVLVGPNVSIITMRGIRSKPSQRRAVTIGNHSSLSGTSGSQPVQPSLVGGDGGRKLGCGGGVGGYQGRPTEYPGRRKSSAGHSFPWRREEANIRKGS